ncbi:glycosyltransferase family 4 protein [Mechercharimyces sp. CAU 1602]|uniref:glycosyltransferase family 4 protein n=1 Tax=Mechercharimyces sp. CAU 1602 TaxID=2973933 RepID=UPI002162A38C|nr:glycosyltransferase family 4 protein [Mechercharimyces sp. CAU 1602]MCS1352248.1 glycosyltransferase family 4 protein [Mechercharimyces sp. CAU 1602]
MRIWVANHYAVPPHIGGITRHYELAQAWVEQDDEVEVTLWLSQFLHSSHQYVTPAQQAQTENLPRLHMRWLWSLPYRGNNLFRMLNMLSFALLFGLVGMWQRRPDVILASSPHLFTALTGWALARLKNCPFVLEVRDLWPDSLIKMRGLKRKTLLVHLLERIEHFLYFQADQIVVLTEHQRQYIAHKGVCIDQIVLIPNGIVQGDLHSVQMHRESYRKRMGAEEAEFIAIYAGAHGPANALHHVVKAGAYIPEGFKIVLIGDGSEKKQLQQLKEEKGLKNVLFLDPVPKKEVYRYLYAADCGIISLANNETFRGARPNKLFDYIYVGHPIVTTVGGEVESILRTYDLGVFAGAEDAEALAETIQQVKKYSPARLQQMKENGKAYINNQGDRRKLAERLLLDLKRLVIRSNKRK